MRKTPGNPRTSARQVIPLRLGALHIAAPAPQSYLELRNRIHTFLGCRRLGRPGVARRILHETYMQLLGRPPARRDEAYFPLLIANLLRQLLTAHSRAKPRLPGGDAGDISIVDIDAALALLETRDALSVRLIELHYFAGIDPAEAGAILLLEPAAVTRRLRTARAWLAARLAGR